MCGKYFATGTGLWRCDLASMLRHHNPTRQRGRSEDTLLLFLLSISILLLEHYKEGPQQNLQIQPDRPFADITMVAVDTFLHLVERLGLAAMAFDLREPSYTGFTLCRSM